MLRITRLVLIVSIICAAFTGVAQAEPRTDAGKITKLRPYTNGDYFVTLDNNILGGVACTTTYRIQSTDAGSKAVIASILTAYALGQSVQIEVPSGGDDCEGFGTPIQSVFLAAPEE